MERRIIVWLHIVVLTMDGGILGFVWSWVDESCEGFGDVRGYVQVDGAHEIVPLEADATK